MKLGSKQQADSGGGVSPFCLTVNDYTHTSGNRGLAEDSVGFVDLISLNQRKQTVIKAAVDQLQCNLRDEEEDVIEMGGKELPLTAACG